jgi:hypothetical protein
MVSIRACGSRAGTQRRCVCVCVCVYVCVCVCALALRLRRSQAQVPDTRVHACAKLKAEICYTCNDTRVHACAKLKACSLGDLGTLCPHCSLTPQCDTDGARICSRLRWKQQTRARPPSSARSLRSCAPSSRSLLGLTCRARHGQRRCSPSSALASSSLPAASRFVP